ncbi:MAG: hypothetical protein LBU89_02340 [Fibromonadaceae bacterium]|jgi:hypothetical protein|nr:hypothetical protein [Fibromonadaceae bacterium]
MRTLLLSLFLAALALLIIILFMKKSKEQDAQGYARQNPQCSEIKVHSEKNDLVECFLNFETASFPANPQDVDTLYISMVKLISERFPNEFPLRVRYIFSFPNKVVEFVGISGKSINIFRDKSSEWRDKNSGCKFPGICPIMPLKGSSIPQKFLREDNNVEQIFRNKFTSIGEAPVNSILPGKILKISEDSHITIYHGENIYTTTSGLSSLSDYVHEGAIVTPDIAIGFLPPKDTAFVFVEIRRNGKHELWDKFYWENRE